jgi:hypothetical protein
VAKTGGLVFNGDPSLPAQFNLNLSSVTAAYAANISQPTQIYVGGVVRGNGIVRGGTAETITPGELLTPSQYVALGQVTATGHQSLVLTANGAASSGFLTLTPADVSGLTALYVPAGVSLNSIGFTQATPLLVSGATNVNGSLFALQQARGLVAQLDFGSLTVGSGGLITSNLPRNISLFSDAVSASGLTVNVTGDLHNSGTISTQGILSLSAGGGIYNDAASSVITGSAVSLYSASGAFANAGLIAASTGNVNFASQMNSDINLNNAGGTVSALAGSINFRDASYNGSGNLSINGGNLLANSLNLYSGQGNVDVNSGTVQGVVNVYAGSAHVVASTNDLQLGIMDVSGDPLFYNQQTTDVNGNVLVNGDISIIGNVSGLQFSGQDLALVAGGNITVGASGPFSIDTSASTGANPNGGNIYLVAGADIQCTSCVNSANPIPVPGTPAGTGIAVDTGSKTGGSIDLTGVTTINTRGFAGMNDNGGGVLMVAFAGTGSNSGTVNASSTTITTGGTGTGLNGSVVIIAGATHDPSAGVPAVQVGAIDTTGGIGQGAITSPYQFGVVSIQAATPAVMGTGNVVAFTNSGSLGTGSSFLAATYQNTTVSTGSITASGPIQVVSGGSVNVGSISENFASGSGFSPGVLLAAGVGSVPTTPANVTFNGSIYTNGAPLNVVASGNIVTGNTNPMNLDTSSAIAAGGAVTMIAGAVGVATATPVIVTVAVSGPSTFGGNIDLTQASGISTFTTTGANTSTPGAGGNVLLSAYSNTAGLVGGNVILPKSVTLTTNAGSPTLASGNVTIIAGGADPSSSVSSITFGSIDTSGGQSGTGMVSIATQQPTLDDPIIISTGVVTGSAFTNNPDPPPFAANASICFDSINAPGALVQLGASEDIKFSGSVTAGTLQMVSTAGNIGISSNILQVNVGSLFVSAAQNVYLNNSSANVELELSASAGSPGAGMNNTFSLTSNGGSISVNAPVSAGTIDLDSGTGALYITTGGLLSTQGGAINLTGSGVVIDSPISNASSIFITTNNSSSANVVLAAPISASGNVTIYTYLSGNIIQTAGVIQAGQVILQPESGNIGSPGQAIQVQADSLNVSTSGAGSAYISAAPDQTGQVSLIGGQAGGTFQLFSASPVVVNASISAGSVALSATGLNVYDPVTATNGGVMLSANGAGGLSVVDTTVSASHGVLLTASGPITTTGASIVGAAITVQNSFGNITAGSLTSNGGDISIVSLAGGVNLNGPVNTVGTAGAGGNLLVVAQAGPSGVVTSTSIATGGGNVAMVASFAINGGSLVTSGGSAYLSSGGTINVSNLVLGGGMLLATTANPGLILPVSWTSSPSLTMPHGIIVASNPSLSPITVLPAAFNNNSSSTPFNLSPAQIPGGGFLSFNNMFSGSAGTVVLQDDPNAMFSFKYLVPLVVESSVSELGNIRDNFPTGTANFTMVTPSISTGVSASSVQVGGNIKFFSNQINLANPAGVLTLSTINGSINTETAAVIGSGSTVNFNGNTVIIGAPISDASGTINFNPGTTGNTVNVFGGSSSTIAAGLVYFNNSSGSMIASLNSISGIVSASVSGNFALTTAAGGLDLGTVSANQALTVSASSINLIAGASVSTTDPSAGVVTLNTSSLSLSSLATISSGVTSGAAVFIQSAGALQITAADNSFATISSGGGQIWISAAGSQTLEFSKSSGSTSTTLNFNGGPLVTTSSGAATIIDPAVTVASNNNITMNVNNSTLTDNGAIVSSSAASGASITIQSSGALTLAGAPQPITITGNAANASIVVQAQGTNNALNLDSPYTFNTGSGTGGTVVLNSMAGGININASQSVTGTASLTLNSNSIAFAAGAGLSAAATSGNGIVLQNASGGMTIILPDKSFSTWSTGGSGIEILVDGLLTIINSPGLKTTQLNVNGGQFQVIDSGSNAQIVLAAPVTISSNNLIRLNGSSTNIEFTINGSIESTTGIQFSGSGITMDGTPQTIAITGGGSGLIQIKNVLSNPININSSYTFDPGVGGSVQIMQGSSLGTDAINIAANTTLTVGDGSPLSISGPSLVMASGSAISDTATSGIGISLVVNSFSMPAASTTFVSTNGGTILIQPVNNQSLSLSNLTGSGTATLNFTGGAVTFRTTGTSSPAISVGNGVVVTSDSNFTINAQGVVRLGGAVTASDTASLTGSNIQGTGLVTGTTVSLTATTGSIDASGSGAGTAVNTATGNLQLSAPSGSAYVSNTTSGGLSLNGSNISVQGTLSVANSSGISTSTSDLIAGAVSLTGYCITVGSGADIKATSGDVNLTATGDDIKLDAAVTSVTGGVTLSAATDIYLGAAVNATAGTASLTGTYIEGTGVVSGATVSLTATTGSIDASGNGSGTAVNTATSNLQLSAANGSAYISNTSSGGLSLNSNKISVQQTLSVTNNNGISTSTNELAAGAVSLTAYCITVSSGADIKATTGDVNLTATGDDIKLDAGVVSVTGNVTLSAATDIYVGVAVTANGTASLAGTYIEGTGLVSGATVSLTATTGSIDASGSGAGTAVNTATSNLQLSAVNGSAYVNNTSSGGLSLNGSKISVQQTLSVTSNNGISTSTAELAAGSVSITGYCITVGSGADIKATSGDVNLTATGDDIKLDAAVTSVSGNVILDAKTDIYLGAAVNATAGTASLTGSDIEGSGLVSGATVSLTATTGSIDASGNGAGTAVNTATSNLQLSAVNGSAYVSNASAGGLSLYGNNFSVQQTLSVSNNNGISTATSELSAGVVTLSAYCITVSSGADIKATSGDVSLTATGDDIKLDAPVTSVSGNVTLKAKTDVYLGAAVNATAGTASLTGSDIEGSGLVSGGTVSLTATTGSIDASGTGAGAAVNTATSNLQLSAVNGSAYVSNAASGGLSLNGNNISVQQTLSVSSNHGISTSAAELAAGAVTLSAYCITVGSGAAIKATSGDVNLTATGDDIKLDAPVTSVAGGVTLGAATDIYLGAAVNATAGTASLTGTYIEGSGLVSGGTVSLTATTGSIDASGTGAGTAVNTATSNLQLSAVNGSAYVSNTASGGLSLNGNNISVQQTLSVSNNHGISTSTAELAAGAVTLSAYCITVGSGADIKATSGDVSLTATGDDIKLDAPVTSVAGGVTLHAATDVYLGAAVNATAGTASLTGTYIEGTGLVSGGTVSLTATTGSIDASGTGAGTAVNTATSNLQLSAVNGSAYVNQTGAVALSPANVSVKNTLQVTSSGIMTVSGGTLTAGTVDLATTGGNDIALTTGVDAGSGSGNVTINSSGNVTGTGTITGGLVSLTATDNIQSNLSVAGSRVNTAATSLDVSASNAFLSQTGSLTINGNHVSVANTFDITDAGSLTVSGGMLAAGTVNLATTGGHDIALTSGVDAGSGSGNVTINSSGNVTGTGTITGDLVSLTATDNIQSNLSVAGSRVNTVATSLDVSASNAFLSQTGSLTLNDSNVSVTNTFDITDAGSLTVSGSTLTAGTVNLATTGGHDIALTSGVDAGSGTGNVTINSSGNITGAGTITGGLVSLTAADNIQSNLSVAGSRVNTAATSLDVSASNAFLSQTGSLTINGNHVSVTNTFDITDAGSLTVSGGTLAAGTVNLATTGGNDIALTTGIDAGSGSGNVTINSSGNVTGTGTITGGLVSLTATDNIQSNLSAAGSRVNTAATSLDVSASNAYLSQTGSVTLNGNDISVTNTFDITDAGSLTVSGGTLVAGTVNLATTGGNDIALTTGVNAGSGAGNVTINSSGNVTGTGTITGGLVSLTATDNIQSNLSVAGSRVNTAATSLDVSASNAYLSQTGSLTLNGNHVSVTNTFDITDAGSLTVSGGTLLAGTVNLATTGGNDIALATGVDAGSGSGNVTINSSGNVTGTGTITGGLVSLTATDNIQSNLSVAGSRVNTAATSLDVSASNAFLSQTGSLTLNGSNVSVTNTFDIIDAGSLTVSGGTLTAGTVKLATTGGNDIALTTGVDAGSGAGNVTINSSGNVTGTGTITGGLVSLTATDNIQSNLSVAGSRVNTAATSLDVSASNAFLSQTGSLTLNDSNVNVTNTFDITDAGLLTVSGSTLTAGTVKLATTGGNDIALTSGITANSGVISLSASGSITGVGSLTTSGQDVILTATNGSIGTGSASVNTAVGTNGTLTATALNGGVYIQQSGGGILLSFSQAGSTFQLDTAQGSNGDITILGGVTVGNSGTIKLTADGSIIWNTGSALTGNTVNLVATQGSIGSIGGTPVLTAAANLTAKAAGDVFISQAGTTILGASSAGANNTFELIATAGLTPGSIAIGGALSAGTVDLYATGNGSISDQSASVISGTTANLTSVGNIGSDPSIAGNLPVMTAVANLSANSTSGSVFIINSGAVTLVANNTIHNGAAGTFELSTTADPITGNGSITVSDTVTATTITLQSSEGTNSGPGITNIGGIAQGTGGLLTANTITLSDSSGISAPGSGNGNGNIGSLANGALNTATPTVGTLTLTAVTNGGVYISQTGAFDLSTSSAGAGNDFVLNANGGALTLINDVSAGNEVKLTAGSISSDCTVTGQTVYLQSTSGDIGPISVNAGQTLTVVSFGDASVTQTGFGSINLTNSSAGSSGSGNTFDLTTSGGNITVVGQLSADNVSLTTVGSASILEGASGVVSGITVNLTASTGTIGSPIASINLPLQTQAQTLIVNTAGNVYVNQTGSVTLGDSSGRIFKLIVASGDLTLGGNLNYNSSTGPDLTATTKLQVTSGNIIYSSGGVGGGTISLVASAGTIGSVNVPVQAYTNLYSSLVTSSVVIIPPTTTTFVVCNGCTEPPARPSMPSVEHQTPSTPTTSTTSSSSTPSGAGNQGAAVGTQTTPQSSSPPSSNSANLSDSALGTDSGTGTGGSSKSSKKDSDKNESAGGTGIATGHFDAKTIASLRNSGVDIGEGSNNSFIILNRGSMLFQPTTDMTVRVQEGTVFVPNGATAYVIETGHDVAVYDMHDGHHGSVKVQVGKKLITLTPGKQLVLTRDLAADFDRVNPGSRIAYRGVHGEVVAEGIKAYAADFSIPSIMMNVAPLKRMLASDIPSERRQAHKLLKNAVILAQMTGQAGPFQTPPGRAPIQP